MRAAERGKEVVQHVAVRQIYDGHTGAPLETIAVEHVVVSQGQIEQTALLDSWRIAIVVFGSGRRYRYQV